MPEFDPSLAVSKLAAAVAAKYGPSFLGAALSQSKKIADYFLSNFSEYLEHAARRCMTVKTLISRDTPLQLYDIYTDTKLSSGGKTYTDLQLIDFIKSGGFAAIVGNAGSGKSMLMRHLFISLIENTDALIPIFIEMRNINSFATKDLAAFIQHTCVSKSGSISTENFRKGLQDGIFIIILDGFDEIDHDKRSDIERQIIEMQERYHNTRFVISSRPDERFQSWSQFTIYSVEPMTQSQVVSLMNKMPYDKDIKVKFIKEIRNGLYSKHTSFLSNPLLATMMLITFDQFAHIPDKIHIFYEQAFETLFFKHDSSKQAAFKRKMYSDLAINDFKNCLSSFCITTYMKEKFQFSESELLEFINQSLDHEQLAIKPIDFASDLFECLCIMQRDGLQIVFTHRSFQEYFTSFYISRVPPVNLPQLLDRCAKRSSDDVIAMTFDMNRDFIEREWVLPRLAEMNAGISQIDLSFPAVSVANYIFGELQMSRMGSGVGIMMSSVTDIYYFYACIYRLYENEFQDRPRSRSSMKRDAQLFDNLVALRGAAPETKSASKPQRRRGEVITISKYDEDHVKDMTFFKDMRTLPAFLRQLEQSIRDRVSKKRDSGLRLIN